ncbi:MAG TPA: CCA tRNA nucleotidyltransferase [Longimicrobiales bacterium]|nr:CCA tRNA nucleotidyltransferase [Longimicrobiales bacterium]
MTAEELQHAVPAPVRRVATRLEDAGYEAWAVGGAVRDVLLGRPGGDWDLATAARPDEVRRLFRRTVPIGIEHGTVGVLEGGVLYEVTTFRRDVETFGRHAVVEFADTIDEDLSRRDFTCNALAWRPATGELRDPFHGREDLEQGRLRTVGEAVDRFAEDYLRILRALRFAGQFELRIVPDTWRALRAAVGELRGLSAERVREELWKVLGRARAASHSLSLYADAGVLNVLYPELAAVHALDDGPDRVRPWDRSLGAVDALPPKRTLLRAAALLHAIGMPAARTKDLRGGWRYTGHEVLGARKAGDVMARLKASNADTQRLTRLVGHQRDLFPPDAPDAGVRRWLRHVGADLVRDLFRLRFALWRGANEAARPDDLLERWHMAHTVLRSRPALDVTDLAIGGHELRELGMEPGPRFGEILDELLERVTEDPSLNERTALLELVRSELIGP